MKSCIRLCAAIAGCSVLMALPAGAATYHFSGHLTPTDSGAGNILNYVDRHAPLTFDFSTATPLAANLAFSDERALATSWEASGGSAASTIDSSDLGAVLATLQFSTDGLGNVLRYNIAVRATNAELPGKQWVYTFANFDPSNVFERVELDTLQFNGVIHYTTLDSALICTNACGGSGLGAFSTVAESGTGVPEPATWALMISGLGLSGAVLRRRRAVISTAAEGAGVPM